MGIVIRQSLKSSAVTLTGALLGAGFTFLASRTLPAAEWGISRNLINQGMLAQNVLLLGSISLVFAYVPRYHGQPEKRRALLTLSFLLPLLGLVIFAIPYFLFEEPIIQKFQARDRPYLRMFFGWMPLLSVLSSYMALMEYFLSSQMKVAKATLMREVVLRVMNLLLLLAYYLGWISFPSFVIGTVLVFGVPLVLLLILCLREPLFRFSLKWWHALTQAELRDAIHYAWYHMLTQLTFGLMILLDPLLLMPLSANGSNDVAVYNNAILFISFMLVPYRAMTNAVFPKLNEAMINGHKDVLQRLFQRASVNMLAVSLYMSVAILCVMPPAVSYLPAVYQRSIPVVLILLVGRVADYLTGLNAEVISITPQYRFNFRTALLLIISVVILDRLFIPRYGLFGAAWVSSGTIVLFNTIKSWYLYKHTGLNPITPKSILMLLGATAIAAGVWVIPRLVPPFADIIARGALVTGAFTALVLLVRPSEDVNALLGKLRLRSH